MNINQITIPCTDYAASVEFYKALGFIQIVDAPPRYARFESEDGEGATLSLHAADSISSSGVVVYFDHPSSDTLDAHVSALTKRGYEFTTEPTDQPWGWREARLHDPARNEICLMYAGTVRRFPSWRVDGKQA